MKITKLEAADFDRVKAIEANAGAIADGTFCVVRQLALIEIFAFTGLRTDPDEWASKQWYNVTITQLPDHCDGLYNSSESTGGSTLADLYSDHVETVYFDDTAEAYAFFGAYIAQHPLNV